jgi:uncharacterized damage-inducible protein DinB
MTPKPDTLLPAEGLTHDIGICFAALEEVRAQLRDAVVEMPDDLIARHAAAGAHPIAALLLHIGEAEWWWMQCVIAGHELTEDDKRALYWDVLLDEGDFARHGYSARRCLEVIDRIRTQTRDVLAKLEDGDLDRLFFQKQARDDMQVSLRWTLHHLVDHEAQHKGQILLLKRLLNGSQQSGV